MEYIDGHDLKTILKRGEERDQPLTVEIALFVASKIAAALDYAHRKHDFEGKEMGLVHRDVSPQNVLISQEGDIKLCDFGIAKAASKASHTQAGALKGKLQYMSPEQAWGRSIDKRSDIFALATVLFEMLTGRKLFTGDNELSILEQVREARVTLPSEFNEEVTPEIDKIVVKALQKDPANRYQTAGEMERDINAILYTFRPTPTSADLAIFMHRLLTSAPVVRDEHDFGGDPFATVTPHSMPAPPAAPAIVAAPPLVAPAPSPAPAIATPTFGIDETPKKAPIVPIAVGVAALLAIVIGVVMMNKKSAAPATPVPAVTKPATTTAPQTASTGTISPTTTAPTSTAPALDQSKVNEEVQKRLAAERARLEQQQKTQPAAAAAAPTQVARNTPPPIAAAPQPQPQTPAPVTQPVERPVVPAPAPQPVPQPTAPAPAQEVRAREGDTVAAGTEGLTPPRMTHQAPVSYPPMAKMQHIEGVVIMSVSVNETGQVMEVRVIKGDPRLNAAAEQSVRRSSFSAATKDGVHVKSSVPVSINFKL
jgi:TonB family protein